MYYCGCDLGSTTGKVVIIDDERICAWSVINSTRSPENTAAVALDMALEKAGIQIKDLGERIVGTGYGRNGVSYISKNVSEITCHAKGAYYLNPNVRTIVDIGGQDSKVISVAPNGKVAGFQMNEKCAAGTGRFFETMCRVLSCTLDELAEFSLQAQKPCVISSQCGIFAESEVVTLLNGGVDICDIAAGLHNSVARRILSMAGRVGISHEVTVTGGCAKNPALIKSLSVTLNTPIAILPENPQIMGALGAAIVAREGANK